MAHGDAREGKWRGNWRMDWVASTLHITSEHGVSSITTADAHPSAANSRLNWRPPPIYMESSFSPKEEICFLRVCRHISTGPYWSILSSILRFQQAFYNLVLILIRIGSKETHSEGQVLYNTSVKIQLQFPTSKPWDKSGEWKYGSTHC